MNEHAPQSSGDNTNVIIAVVLTAVIVFFAVMFYFYSPVFGPENGNVNPALVNQDILETQEAQEWIRNCERKNPYIKDRCTDLFYYETAMIKGDNALCRKIGDKGIKISCIDYFNSVSSPEEVG